MTALLFVHGLCGDRSDWSAQVDAFAGAHEVIALNLPGHAGLPPPREATLAALAKPLVEAVSQLGDQRIVLVGHSMGCRVILEASQYLRGRIAGVAFLEQNLVTGANVEAAVAALERRLAELGTHEFLTAAFEGMFVASTPQDLRRRVLARIRMSDADFLRGLLLDALRCEAQAAGLLSRLGVPVLMVQSTWLDESFQWHSMEPGRTTPWTRLVASNVPHAELRSAVDVGHFSMIEAPHVVSGFIRDFLDRFEQSHARSGGAAW